MPAAFVTEINRLFLQALPIVTAVVLLTLVAGRASYRFIRTFPDSAPEKPDLLRAAAAPWLAIFLLLGLLTLYVMLVHVVAPLTSFVAGFLVALVPVLIMERRNPAITDAPLAVLEVLGARLQHRPPDPERWLALYRKAVARRQRLAWLRYAMYVITALLAIMAVVGYITVDRVLAGRLQATAVEQDLQTALATRFEGTVFAQTPPCVPVNTMYLIPGRTPTRPAAQETVASVVQWLSDRGERQPWRVTMKTGEGPPLAEATYPGR